MKKLVLALACVALAVAMFSPADASGRRMVVGQLLKWEKGTATANIFSYDSTRVTLEWGQKAPAPTLLPQSCDTTQAVDLSQIVWPSKVAAADSTAPFIGIWVKSYVNLSGADAATTDSSLVIGQVSLDGSVWSNLATATDWRLLGEASNTVTQVIYNGLNRLAVTNQGFRFIRFIVCNVGATATAGATSLARKYEARMVYWAEQP